MTCVLLRTGIRFSVDFRLHKIKGTEMITTTMVQGYVPLTKCFSVEKETKLLETGEDFDDERDEHETP